ncbi:hypothetical protein KDAU_50600 [Dictyobacter aurantiacus]|uniref:Uncharacterized protein n=1 Tax=Dictyobacter aurantiacus TaxID=1936993 RepID=A0A401ZLH5_9CHLR|nr:hypothetical protein KDAU_50600 [Dictyobacter aurantiacus]
MFLCPLYWLTGGEVCALLPPTVGKPTRFLEDRRMARISLILREKEVCFVE